MKGFDNRFRAIIVGGGPVGLTLAHTLDQAGIDYLILESRETVLAEEGASLILTPNTLRLYAQLGILEDALKVGAPVGTTRVTTWAGKAIRSSSIISARSQQSHGVRPHAYHRLHVMKVLYETLAPASRQRILTGKKVVDIQTTRDGVQVHCLDNTTYEGSIVIGADGVHSKTRGFMRALALAAGTDPAMVNPEKPLIASYRCMWGSFPTPAGSLPGDTDNCHGPNQSASIIHGKEWSWFFMYECLAEPTQARRNYTEADMEAFAESLGEMHVSPKLQFKAIWASRFPRCAGMSDLPEGAVSHWSWDRIVLAGDAGWKVTPNMGMGYNGGVQCAVALTNALHELIQGRGVAQPSTRELEGAFADYAVCRQDWVTDLTMSMSRMVTRQTTWPTTTNTYTWRFYQFLDWLQTFFPSLDGFLYTHVISDLMRSGMVLDFVHGVAEPFVGTVPWTHLFHAEPTKDRWTQVSRCG